MVDFEYLAKGLYAMARAHRVNTMAGHLGAAVAAGYFISEQRPNLDAAVYRGIESELDRIIRGESVFSPRNKAKISVPEMFEPFEAGAPRPDLIDGIAEALAGNIDQTRQSGHNVIFASIAIRALKDHPQFAAEPIAGGIRRLIAGFNGATPGSGNYGKPKGRIDGRRVRLPEDDAFPPYKNLEDMAVAVLKELVEHGHEHRQGYGSLWHVINHAAGLAELAQRGYEELAARGLAAHRQHMRLWRTLPNLEKELGTRVASEHSPYEADFWSSGHLRRDSALLTHRIKTIYGFDALVELVDDETLCDQARDRFRYLM